LPADLEFELSMLLSDVLGREVRVLEARFEPGEALLCVRVEAGGGAGAEACTRVRACRGLSGAKALRCLSRTLAHSDKPLLELAEELRRRLPG